MSEQAAFVARICEDPHDVGIRLIYADWLDEHGEADRAEFAATDLETSYFIDKINGPEQVSLPPDGSCTADPGRSTMSEQSSNPSVLYQPILEFPGYFAGSDGSIWSCWERFYPKGKPGAGVRYRPGAAWTRMKTNRIKGGYLEVQLRRDGKSVHAFIHRLVLMAFVGTAPDGQEAFHVNNIPDDNRLSNLRWATRRENQLHRKKFGTDNSGERQGGATLTNQQADEVRRRFKVVGNKAAVAREFGISRTVAARVIRGETYRS